MNVLTITLAPASIVYTSLFRSWEGIFMQLIPSGRSRTIGGFLVFSFAMTIGLGSAKADITAYSTPNIQWNGLNFGPDGTPNPPTPNGYWEMGNSVTLAGGNSNLTTVLFYEYGGESTTFPISMDIYAGTNPNTGTLLGSASSVAGYGPNWATFNFGGLYLPTQTVTFIVGLPTQHGSYDDLFSAVQPLTSATQPTVGSALNGAWYGTAPGNFIFNSTYAQADGSDTNLLDVTFNTTTAAFSGEGYSTALTPEPGFYGLLALGLSGLVTVVSRRRKAPKV